MKTMCEIHEYTLLLIKILQTDIFLYIGMSPLSPQNLGFTCLLFYRYNLSFITRYLLVN